MKNILVVFTGGTIGSSVCNGEINTDTQTHFLLLSQFNTRNPHVKTHFTTLQPYEILSENLTPETWTTLIQSIENANPNAYDGIIITHGTDTLAYTSSAIHLYFHALSVPIFLVSSQYPLSDERANGLDNFSYAVNKILEGNLRGVFVPYRNTHSQDITLHYGTHLTCSPELSSDFFSVTPHHKIEHTVKALKKLKPNFSTRILIIKPYPGINYDNFNLDNVDVILHDLYHSGTACTTPEYGHNYSLVYFIRRCKALNIPVFLAPAFKSTQFYQSTIELKNYEGAEMIWNTSIEAAYAKLLLAYGNFEHYEDILIFLNDNVAGEQI